MVSPGSDGSREPPVNLFMCVHSRDFDRLLELSLRSVAAHYGPIGDLLLITNDTAGLRARLAGMPGYGGASIEHDSSWLTREEMRLHHWYRQQAIKLRSFRFWPESAFVCSLGADTVILRPISHRAILQSSSRGRSAILYYNRHPDPGTDWHLDYERTRLMHVSRLLGTRPHRSWRYADFIFDFHCFDCGYLRLLDEYLVARFGRGSVWSRLAGVEPTPQDLQTFGEFTMYACFLLDVLQADPPVRKSGAHYLQQVHTARALARFRWDARVVHFVDKQLPRELIEQLMQAHGLGPTPMP